MLNPGHILDGKYEIINVLGQGGMSTVYLCRNNRLGNLWAVKEVSSELKKKMDFLAEPNILKNLQHSGILRIVDIFYEEDNLYIVEDYIQGKTLKEYIDYNGPLTSDAVMQITLELCSILDYLHSLNPPIIYRDLKPSNIMIKPDNKVVLIDFGIARTYKDGQEGDTIILGSRGYIAPEQLVNIQSNAQTDIYSLGATMFFMLTGKSIDMPTELMFDENYPESADKKLIRIIKTAASIVPTDRFGSVKEIMKEINAAISDLEYKKTSFMIFSNTEVKPPKSSNNANKKPRKKTKFIIITVLALIIGLVLLLTFLLNNKESKNKASNNPSTPKAIEKTEPKSETKPEVQPPKEVIEKDAIVRGILYSKKPILLSTSSNSGKGKNKDKDDNKKLHVQFTLNPAASVSNSKLSVVLPQVQVIEDDVIAVLNLENLGAGDIKLDLNKTYLINGKNEAVKSYNPNSTNLLAIPQGTGKQELKLYFKDFDFEGNSCTLKTVLTSREDKNIDLYIDIK